MPMHSCPNLSKWRHKPNTQEKIPELCHSSPKTAIADPAARPLNLVGYMPLYRHRPVTTEHTSRATRINPPGRAVINSSMPFSVARQGHEPRFPKLYTGDFPAKPAICILFASCPACPTPYCTSTYNSMCGRRRNLYLIVTDICKSFNDAMILASVTFQVRIKTQMS